MSGNGREVSGGVHMSEGVTLGSTIRRLRQSAGLNQRQLADRVQVSATYVSHLESGRREPSIQILRRLAQELQVPPGLLLGIVMWTELPAEQREPYRKLLDNLVELAQLERLRLELDDDAEPPMGD